jgi:hypothetical protein
LRPQYVVNALIFSFGLTRIKVDAKIDAKTDVKIDANAGGNVSEYCPKFTAHLQHLSIF